MTKKKSKIRDWREIVNPLTGEREQSLELWQPLYSNLFEVQFPFDPVMGDMVHSIEIEPTKIRMKIVPCVDPKIPCIVPSLQSVRHVKFLSVSEFDKQGSMY